MTDLEKYLELERLEYEGEIETKRKDLDEKIRHIEQDYARRGIARSGGFFHAITQARAEFRRDLALTRISIRRKYGAHFSQLVSDVALEKLQEELERSVQVGIQAQQDDFRRRNSAAGVPSGGTVGDAIDRRAQIETSSEIAVIRREISKLKLQRGLGMVEKKGEDRILLNINNSTVSGLNLGTIIGDMNATLTTLKEQGNAQLANALKALSEAVAANDQLGEVRRELLENISVLGEQGKLPPTGRKMGIVKAAYRHLGETIAIAGHSASIWATWGPQIATFFGLPH